MAKYFAFQWHITDECDQRCKHCYIFNNPENVCLHSMNWEQMMKVLSNCEEFCQKFGRIPYFYLTGGDPILHPEFWRLLEEFHNRNIKFTIMGNPFHLTDEVAGRLKSLGCDKYQMSIDGMEQTHDWFRKPGSFKKTLETLETLKKTGICAVIMSTVSDKNIDKMHDVIDTVVKYGADVFAFSRYCPTPDDKVDDAGDNYNDELGLSAERYHKFLQETDKQYKEYEAQGCHTKFNRKDHLWTLLAYEQGEFQIPENAKPGMIYGGCNCGNCHMTILSTGELYACRRCISPVGSVFTDKISDIWLTKMDDYRQYEKFEKCARCKLLAWCRGCPSVAYGTYGNFYAPDPQCWMQVE